MEEEHKGFEEPWGQLEDVSLGNEKEGLLPSKSKENKLDLVALYKSIDLKPMAETGSLIVGLINAKRVSDLLFQLVQVVEHRRDLELAEKQELFLTRVHATASKYRLLYKHVGLRGTLFAYGKYSKNKFVGLRATTFA